MPVKTVTLYDEIGYWGTRAVDFQRQMQALGLTAQDELLVALNSPGGEIYDGLAIHAQIRHATCAKRTVRIDGLAASMASVVAMAGDEIQISEGGLVMIHDPSSIALGTAEDLRDLADVLDKHRDALVSIYERRTGKTGDEIRALMAAETWMTASEAVAQGFATAFCGAAPPAQARFAARAFDRFTRAPDRARSYFTARAPAPAPKETPMSDATKRRRSLVLALLQAVCVLGAQDPADKEIEAAGKALEPHAKTLRGLQLGDPGDPLALLGAVEASAGRELTLTEATAEVLVLQARATAGAQSEGAVKAALIDDAIKAGKPIAPHMRAAWQALPLDRLRATIEALPTDKPLPTAQRKPSAGETDPSKVPTDALPLGGGDESFKTMHDGLLGRKAVRS